MTLIVAIILGPIIGYKVGMRRKAFTIWSGVFLFALLFQSFVTPYIPFGGHNIDLHDPGYWLVQPIFLLIGLGTTWGAAKLKDRRSHSLSPA